MPNVLTSLFNSRKFWLAVFGVIQTLVFTYVPNFPKEVWIAIDVLVITVIAGITAEDSAAKSAGNAPSKQGLLVDGVPVAKVSAEEAKKA